MSSRREDKMIDVIIEIPLNSKITYKVTAGVPRVEEIRYFPLPYPLERGFVEDTLLEDGQCLKALVLNSESTVPGGAVPARVIGYLEMYMDGQEDYRILAVADCNRKYKDIDGLQDVSHFTLKEITDYYTTYGKIHDKSIQIVRYHSKEEALQLVEDATKRAA